MQLIPFLGAQANILLEVKKNPDEKYVFIMEKFDFEKKFSKNQTTNFKIPLAETIFLCKPFTKENRFG